MQVIGELLQNSTMEDGTPFADAPDKVAALTACWQYMKEHPELIKENPEVTRYQAIENAKSPAELRRILQPGGGTGLWNTR